MCWASAGASAGAAALLLAACRATSVDAIGTTPAAITSQAEEPARLTPAPFDPIVAAIATEMETACVRYEAGDIAQAKASVSDAYYVLFEAKGMETAIRQSISAARVFELEQLFSDVRQAMSVVGAGSRVRQASAVLVRELQAESRRLGASS